MHIRIHKRQLGFTIVELMIATLAFSAILLVITAGVTSFTHDYYRGINDSTTQDTTRQAMNSISQAIQFGSPSGILSFATSGIATQTFCVAGKQYVMNPGHQLGKTLPDASSPQPASAVGLYVVPARAGCATPRTVSGGTELLGPNMRLNDLSVTQTKSGSSLYSINLRVSYGDKDLLCSPSATTHGQCGTGQPIAQDSDLVANDVLCKGTTGSQFCSVAALQTTVERRGGN